MPSSGEPSATSVIGIIFILLCLILLSMIFSASESGFLSLNKLRIRFLRNKKNKKALEIGKLLDKKEKLINTLLVGNNIVNISLTTLLTSLFLQLFGQAGIGIATLISTIILLIFGEIIPKTLGSHHPETITFLTVRCISFFSKLLKPFVAVFTFLANSIAKLIGIKRKKAEVSFTEEEIKSIIEIGEEEGIVEEEEKILMHRVFKFTDLSAKDIMVPRTKICAIHVDATYQEVIALSKEKQLSRFPVYQKNIDDIKGILYMKDVLRFSENPEKFSAKEIMRSPHYIFETKKMSSIQQTLRENKQSIAIVLDEYSSTAGLLTMYDIAQSIFGSLQDEYDTAPSQTTIHALTKNEILADGSTKLTEINELFQVNLDSEFYETIGGYLSEKFDAIPQVDTQWNEQDLIFTVKQSTDRQILSVHIKKAEATEEEI